MDRLHVVIAPHKDRTDVLMMAGPVEVLRARLGAPGQVHRLAAPLLLEGLSLWHQLPLSVVLSVTESDASSALIRSLCDGLHVGSSTRCYAVDLHTPARRATSLGGAYDVRALKRLCPGGQP